MENQIHYGKKFYLDKATGYWISTACPKIRAHVYVWKYNHGDIEKGLHIHHKDGNKSNNEIQNLECLNAKEHASKHKMNEERSAKNALHMNAIRPLTKKWHASEEGIAWHSENGIKVWEERKPFTIVCKQCEKTTETKTFHQDFCSNNCKSQWRRKEGLDNEERLCPICNTKFQVNKYAKKRFCSKKCGGLFRRKKH